MKKIFALIGENISHSLSKTFFESNHNSVQYLLIDLKNLHNIKELVLKKGLDGFNVTSPFKQEIIPYLDLIDNDAKKINSVNCVKIHDNKLIGYNTDWIGFQKSLIQNTDISALHNAIIMGTGGAGMSVAYALTNIGIDYSFVSSHKETNHHNIISYHTLNAMNSFSSFNLIINATPCGMDSREKITPIDINKISSLHTVYDLIYHPKETLLLKLSRKKGAKTINGYDMLIAQAKESWRIWNE